ncbi:GAF domain-containing protein [Nocardioides anomalus]|uniref:GAF domain-containing protein n=1 Tax=Nocardioides anomalus TaxID=2712223 RepID=A0A6G6WFF9_9ACTN|nr:GAF domain-containing protein [Nocardioides anomalus]QIG43780.1 GAF domain-containing protein [Nocardioides anomalus]
MGEELDEVCAAVRDVFAARACVCGLVRGDVVEFVAGDGQGAERLKGTRLRVGQGIAGYVAQAGVAVEVHDVPTDERFASHLPVHEEYVPATLIGAPLFDDHGAVRGVLHVLDPACEVLDELRDAVGSPLPVLRVVADELARMAGQTRPDSEYAVPPPVWTLSRAEAIRRAVKSAQRSRTS